MNLDEMTPQEIYEEVQLRCKYNGFQHFMDEFLSGESTPWSFTDDGKFRTAWHDPGNKHIIL